MLGHLGMLAHQAAGVMSVLGCLMGEVNAACALGLILGH